MERICGLTTTMYAIVKKVVIPAIASVLRLGLSATMPQRTYHKMRKRSVLDRRLVRVS